MNQIKVGMIILLQPDVDKAVEFYQKFGFQKKFHLKGQWAEMLIGDIKLGLCPTTNVMQDHHTGIVFEVADLHALYNELSAQGVEFLAEPKAPEHGIMVSFKDLGNNIIDLYQPTPEKIKNILQTVLEKSAAQTQENCDTKKSCDNCDCSKVN